MSVAVAAGSAPSIAVSVVVCAYTEARWDDLTRAVASLRRQSSPPHEVIVVVDHNPALLQRAGVELPDVVAVANRHERGLSGARNTGVEIARGTVVAFLDDDAVASDDWLERLVEAYDDECVMGVGGTVEPQWPSSRPRGFPAEFDWVVGCTYLGLPETTTAVRNVIGANMSFRRAVFDEIGPFVSGIGRIGTRPLGCEETELCIRVRRRWPDAVIVHEPRARVAHRVPPERATLPYFVSRCYSEGLSKALVARLSGARDGLSSERTYAMRTLPRGVARGVGAGLTRDPTGFVRAGAILLGLLVTTTGYLVGRTRRLMVSRPVSMSTIREGGSRA